MRPMNKKNDLALSRILNEYEKQYQDGTEVFFSDLAFQQILQYFKQEQEYQKALEACDQAISQHTYRLEFYLEKAQLLLKLRLYPASLEVMEQAKLLAPEESEIELLAAEAWIGQGMTEEALAILNDLKLTATLELMSEVHLLEAMAYTRDENHERAFYMFKAAIEADNKNETAIRRFALCVEATRKFEQSVELHQSLVDKDAYNALAWYNLGQAHEYLGNYFEALEAYEYAYLIDNSFSRACRDSAVLHFEQKNYEKARALFEELFNHTDSETDSDLHIYIGRCYLELGSLQSASIYLQQAVKLDPLNDEAFFYLGQCCAEQEKWTMAERYLEKAIQIEDQRDEYYAVLGEVHYYLEDHASATACMREAIELNEENSRYWILLATFLIDAGEKEEALAVLEEGMYLMLSMEVTYCYVACLLLIGRRQEALYRLGEALTEDFEAHNTLFQVFPDLEGDPGVRSVIASFASY